MDDPTNQPAHTDQWRKRELGADHATVHPLVNAAFDAHQQIEGFIAAGTTGITPEIWEVTELAFKIKTTSCPATGREGGAGQG